MFTRQNERRCINCRYWVGNDNAHDYLRECHANPPHPVLGSVPGLWPLTHKDDGCGKWAEGGYRVVVTDEMMLGVIGGLIDPEWPKEATEDNEERRVLLTKLKDFRDANGAPGVIERSRVVAAMKAKNVPVTTTIDRLRSMEKRGLIKMGRAPEPYRDPGLVKSRRQFAQLIDPVDPGMCVWIDGAAPIKTERIRRYSTADRNPKWAVVHRVLAEVCPDEAHAQSLRKLLDSIHPKVEGVSLAGLHRYLNRRIADGTAGRWAQGYFVKPDPIQPKPIEVD